MGFHKIPMGPNTLKDSIRNFLYRLNKCKGIRKSNRAQQEQDHQQMLYREKRISMESNIRIRSMQNTHGNFLKKGLDTYRDQYVVRSFSLVA